MEQRLFNLYRRLVFAVALVAIGALTGLPVVSNAQATKKLVVQLATPTPDGSFMNLYVGKRLGYFAEEGLELELHYGAGAPLAAQLAVSGSADIAAMTYEPAIIGYEKGLRGKLIYQTLTHLIYYIAVPTDSPIRTIADLKGKKVGVLGLGTASVFVARSMFKEGNVPVEADTFVPVGVGDLALSALRAGRVDALYLWVGQYAAMERSGAQFRYIYHPRLANVGSAGYFVSDSTLKSRHDELARFTRASARATAFMLANPEQALRLWWAENPNAKGKGSEEDAVARGVTELKNGSLVSFDTSKKADKRFGAISEKEFVDYMGAFKEGGAIQAIPPYKDIVTNEFIEFANNFDVEKAKRPGAVAK